MIERPIETIVLANTAIRTLLEGHEREWESMREKGVSDDHLEKVVVGFAREGVFAGSDPRIALRQLDGKASLALDSDMSLEGAELLERLRFTLGLPSARPTRDCVVWLSHSQIQRDASVQSRVCLNQDTVAQYCERLLSGALFPPPVAFFDGDTYWLADGFHRQASYARAGTAGLLVEVREGSRRDAMLHSVGANNTHGLRRTVADKRRAVHILLSDPEWAGWSDRRIADMCGVHHSFVGRLRPLRQAGGAGGKTRYVQRGGTQYRMATGKIGHKEGRVRKEPREDCDSAHSTVPGVPATGEPKSRNQELEETSCVGTTDSGVCRICGCTSEMRCTEGDGGSCAWAAGSNKTLCTKCRDRVAAEGVEEEELRLLLKRGETALLVPDGWSECTLTITIQISPADGDGGRRVVVTARERADAKPVTTIGREEDLGPLRGLVGQTIAQLQAEFPERLARSHRSKPDRANPSDRVRRAR